MRASSGLLAILCAVSACGGDPGGGDDDDVGPDANATPGSSDPLQGLPTGTEQWMNLCAKGYGDMISAKFCAGTAPPVITSIKELEQLLGLAVVPNPTNDPTLNQNVKITLTGHSTGLGLRSVTPLNPRAFLMTPSANGAPNPSYQVLAFARGEPLVELVANDPAANTLRFFLVRFHPACEAAAAGCNHADLLTPTIESGWTGYSIYDDAAIQNTTLDCLNCHQSGGPGTPKILRMQELAHPWAHWFYVERPANKATMDSYHAAHGSEDYAGIPNANIDPSRPIALQRLVSNNGFATQPNVFDSMTIETELAQGSHATWDAMYAKAVAGLEIPAPYFGTPQTDPAKTAAAITAYQQTMAGTLARDQMPDIADTLLDSALADMSIRPKPGLDGRGILQHMCQMCHNDKLDQTISRARFDVVNLATLSRAAKDEAIRRVRLPASDVKHMPPVRFHTLSDAERDLVVQELSR
jgi:hypothetical protein